MNREDAIREITESPYPSDAALLEGVGMAYENLNLAAQRYRHTVYAVSPEAKHLLHSLAGCIKCDCANDYFQELPAEFKTLLSHASLAAVAAAGAAEAGDLLMQRGYSPERIHQQINPHV